MSLTIKSICQDTKNFFRNQFIIILTISLLCSFITVVLCYILSPGESQILFLQEKTQFNNNISLLKMIQSMSSEQQNILLKYSAASTISGLIGNVFLVSGILLMTQFVSVGQRVNTLLILSNSVLILRKLFILVFLITLLIQIGILLIIIPGILFSIMLSFSPIILVVRNNINIIDSIRDSVRLAWYNMHLVAPAIIIWLLAKTLLLLFSSQFIIFSFNPSVIMINTLNNLISAILLIYLFRLYMLTH